LRILEKYLFCFFIDKMYKAFGDIGDRNHSEFRINSKHAIGTTLLGPGLIFDLNRVVQTFHSKLFKSNKFHL